jgi:hypothetical protein
VTEKQVTMFLVHEPGIEGMALQRETAQYAGYDRSGLLLPRQDWLDLGQPTEIQVKVTLP